MDRILVIEFIVLQGGINDGCPYKLVYSLVHVIIPTHTHIRKQTNTRTYAMRPKDKTTLVNDGRNVVSFVV